MGKNSAKVIEARTKEERKAVRKNLGSLKSLTVQPVTRERYSSSLQLFYDYLRRESLRLPSRRDQLDGLVSDYLEYLWSQGEGRAAGSSILAALQDKDPKLKGFLPGAWRLMKTWATNEVPNRAPPLTEKIVMAMLGWAFFHEEFSFGISLLVAFHAMLRTGELLALQAWQIQMSSASQPAILNLGLTKSGKRQGVAESVTLTDAITLKLLWSWKLKVSSHTYLAQKPHAWRKLFQKCLAGVHLDSWGFRPYSLRRGGATHLFTVCGSLDRVLLAGRWTALKTARIYLNSGLAMLAELKIPEKSLIPWLTIFHNSTKNTPKLEPALKQSRAGGRGKRAKRPKKSKGGGPFFLEVSRFSKHLRPKFPLVWQGT